MSHSFLRGRPTSVRPLAAAAALALACTGLACGSATQADSVTYGNGTLPPPDGAGASSDPADPPFVPAPKTGMVPLRRSAFSGSLRRLGLDPMQLPPMDKLTPEQTKSVMGLFTKSLGYDCEGCHVPGDYKADTRKKRLSHKMWDEFAVAFRTQSGEPLFCDSCHGGRDEFLERSDENAIEKFMQAHYVEKLVRADGKKHDCTSCHGPEGEHHIFEKLWKVPH